MTGRSVGKLRVAIAAVGRGAGALTCQAIYAADVKLIMPDMSHPPATREHANRHDRFIEPRQQRPACPHVALTTICGN